MYYAALNDDVDNGNSVAGSGDDSSDNRDDADLDKCTNSQHLVLSSASLDLELPQTLAAHPDEILATNESGSCGLTAQTRCHDQQSHDKHLVFATGDEGVKMSLDDCPTSVSSRTVKTINRPVQLIPEDEIARNKLSLEDIRAIDKFHNYTEGQPNEVIYVKNLPNKITEEDLIALFGAFQSEGKPRIVFKLLSGRMKGQAFITFPDTATATRAVQVVNGYKLQGRPVILSFGKKHGC
ncbi:unnamed protein product [Candidula unifasciata]|uniref:RRM domain-containing protein n=1 Tax=Candidula unifasciata TaxID=100452 RepID=A0A8S3ZQ19_9EUPU|nr:unnamed protein product [Candidula unifasciata]